MKTCQISELSPCDRFAFDGHTYLLIKPLRPFTRTYSAVLTSGGSAAGGVVEFGVETEVYPLGSLRG